MVNSEELIGTTEYLMLYERYHINRCCFNWVRLYIPLAFSLYDTYCCNVYCARILHMAEIHVGQGILKCC